MRLKAFIILLLFLLAAIAVHPILTTFFDYSKGEKTTKTVFIPKNSTVSQAANLLFNEGVIKSAAKFKILVSLKGKAKSLRPGEYEFSVPDHPVNVLKKITQGKVKTYRVTVPEGLTVREIGALFEGQGLADSARFSAMLYDQGLRQKFSIESPSIEGYLFPETYVIDKTMTENDIIVMMIERFFKEVTSETITRARFAGMSLHEVVTLASMIEKETGVGDERPLISSVFHNRLKKGMRLQCDPTVIYGVVEEEKNDPSFLNAATSSYKMLKDMLSARSPEEMRYSDYRGNLTKKHLTTLTPYNTYMIKGLPRGPISNPGLASIKAAISPDPTNFLYFVSKNDGSHIFSETYGGHLKGVRTFQQNKKG